jgi:hypothetical protein
MSADARATEYGPWNPGLKSQLPREFLPLATIYRPENVFTSVGDAHERSDFTGLEPEDHVTFRPERLVVHEVLIRVTADLSVPDGPNYEDLGINFRRMVHTILSTYVAPHIDDIVRAYAELDAKVTAWLEDELRASVFAPSTPAARQTQAPRWKTLLGFGRNRKASGAIETIEAKEQRILKQWQEKAEATDDALSETAYRVLIRLAQALRIKYGRIRADQQLLTSLARAMICNEYGSNMVGRMIEPHFRSAVEREGWRLLPAQDRPVVMNVKGASASGKSTMRPLQRQLAERLGIPWTDFAVISPDIWRKYLLEYESLGEATRYAGTLTGHELEIIDRKLDRYMAQKAEEGGISHLLIDRFRFDSFAEDPDEEEGSRLLTRFGHLVYMFFMITPPDATVERAWTRGLQFGRYKAVDDLLAHNIEAYTGMPRLFFTWAAKQDKSVHYEFLDNSVPDGQTPKTIAFGWNGEMNVLDTKCLLDVERYRKINVDARDPAAVYPDADTMAPERNTGFLEECARRIPALNFVDRDNGRVYARLEAGQLRWADPQLLSSAIEDPDTRAGLLALAPRARERAGNGRGEPQRLERDRVHTLGQWATSAREPA